MRRIIFYGMIFMMVLWTAAVLADLAQGLYSTKAFDAALAADSPVATAEKIFQILWTGFWGPTAQARAIIWGLPMTVFSMIAALSQR